ncbi:hypothetical protein QBC37DRAFT_380719 [Rhypophila decipiens]|uniref:Uncharacterized protein n=1 Tax=Rhypophila decipiens TaxID=261697 RepID=A0AAN7AZ53_9PEZI|nr:hypothetical protein QBC37DRAFT_380719 [Rhypophila decipiens]
MSAAEKFKLTAQIAIILGAILGLTILIIIAVWVAWCCVGRRHDSRSIIHSHHARRRAAVVDDEGEHHRGDGDNNIELSNLHSIRRDYFATEKDQRRSRWAVL